MGKIGDAALGLGTNIAGGAIGSILGIVLGKKQDQRQIEQQRKLSDMQFQYNKEMLDYTKAKDLEMWKATNYPAQMQQLKEAGLNPGLLYGMSGGGGVTTGGGSQSISTGAAAGHSGEPIALAGMGMQLGMMQAQQELLKSQARLNNVEADKKAGVDTQEAQTRIQNIQQGIENQKAQETLTKTQERLTRTSAYIAEQTADDAIETADWNAEKAHQEIEALYRENIVNKATMDSRIQLVQTQLVSALLGNKYIQATTAKTDAERKLAEEHKLLSEEQRATMAANIVQGWQKLEVDFMHANTEKRKQQQEAFIHDMSESMKIPMNILEKIIEAVTLKSLVKPKSIY